MKQILRRLAERLSRNWELTWPLPPPFGGMRLRVSPGASLTYWRGLDTPNLHDLLDFAHHHVPAGATVWDVGANMGVFSFAAAARAGAGGRVLCLEPDLWSVRLLQHSARLNRGRGATPDILPVAVSREPGLEWLHVPERSRAATHLASTGGGAGAEMTGAIRERHLVPTVCLDWLAARYPVPTVLKIDVDGAEADVLAGGASLMARHRPVLLVEVHDRNAEVVTQLLHGWGYALFNFDRGEAGRTAIDRTAYNTLALPPSA